MGVLPWDRLKHFDMGQVEGRGAVGETGDMLSRMSQICTLHRGPEVGQESF